jgi:mitochondrial fission protein ELM1
MAPGAGKREPQVWALLGPHRGDNNQVLALAEALGVPFEIKSLRYNRWRHLQPRVLGASLRSVSRASRGLVLGDPPDLTISTGNRSAPVVQFIRRRSGGRTRSVHIGFPRLPPERFDLIVATPEYPIPDRPNVLRIPLALNCGGPDPLKVGSSDALPERFTSPRSLLVLGGPSLYWTLSPGDVSETLSGLLGSEGSEGSVLVVGSPRTPPAVLRAVERQIAAATCEAMLVPMNGPPTYPQLLEAADRIFVTADSVAMVSEAVATGKPVGLVKIRQTLGGRVYMSLMDRIRPRKRIYPRDLRFFWKGLHDRRLVGTVEHPAQGRVPDVMTQVVERVRRLID